MGEKPKKRRDEEVSTDLAERFGCVTFVLCFTKIVSLFLLVFLMEQTRACGTAHVQVGLEDVTKSERHEVIFIITHLAPPWMAGLTSNQRRWRWNTRVEAVWVRCFCLLAGFQAFSISCSAATSKQSC